MSSRSKAESMQPVYLDHQATTPLDERVRDAMRSAGFGNPHSSEHIVGWEAAKKIEKAREQVAALIGADADEVFFTSGATEANNLAILGVRKFMRVSKDRILRTPIEHKSVLAACRALSEEFGFEVSDLPVDRDGRVVLEAINRVVDPRTALISAGLVNSEIGVIQDIAAINSLKGDALFHCDAAQGPAGVNIANLAAHCDMMALSAHKMRGPMGIGALYIARDSQPQIAPILFGGEQQSGMRPGTLPLELCVGMGAACELAASNDAELQRIASVKDAFQKALRNNGVEFNLNGVKDLHLRHPGNFNISIKGTDAKQLLQLLQPKVAASTGSACASGFQEPSYVLMAIGLTEEEASSSIRFSIGATTTKEDAIYAAVEIANALSRLV
ncbi:cysteine desulfurase IscS [Pelagibacterium halotolerans]|nr:cysteine desulfurase IscS [Pelagibacterium halotolerans]